MESSAIINVDKTQVNEIKQRTAVISYAVLLLGTAAQPEAHPGLRQSLLGQHLQLPQ